MTLKTTTPYKEISKNLLLGFLISQFCASVSHAQFEDFPPPPPPGLGDEAAVGSTPPFGSEPADVPPLGAPANNFVPSTPPAQTNGGGSGPQYIRPPKGNAKTSILSEKQKSKFSKANPEDITSENFPETIESFDFPNVEITDIIKAISELTGKNFIIDSTVRGKITIIAPSKITVAEAYKAFLSSLAINGFTVVPNGGFLKIRNARSAQRDGIDIYSGSYYPNTDQMITKVVHLKHITAETLKTQLGRLLNSSYGEIEAYPQTNSMIISDFGSSIDRIMKIINQLDVPGFEEQLEVVGIKYAKAKDIADLIDKVVNKGQKSGSGGSSGFNAGGRFAAAPGAVASKGAGTSSFLVFPDDRTNSLIIIGNRAGITRVKKLVGQLDFRVSAESAGGVYVYYVKHGEAEKIAATLSEVAKDSAPKAPTTNSGFGFQPQGQAAVREGVFGGDVSIKADKGTNSLVISASKQDYEKVMNILTKLDIPRDQVFVESIVMEMNMSDGFESSGGLVKFDKDGGKAGFVGKATDLTDILSPLAGAGNAILGFSSGSVSVTDPTSGKATNLPNLMGFLKFIKKFGKTNILSTPQISAMDAQEAEIEVGDKVVTRTTIVPGSNGNPSLSQPEFDDATIKLTIKPFISPSSETIRMEFKQAIKQLSNVQVPSDFAGKVQPLATRNMKTNLVLNNGDTAVIGGLMKDEELETTKKVPVLGDLPILGWLFKSKDVTKTKVNMLVFLTPRIIRNGADQQRLVQEKTNDRLNFLKKNGGKDPYGATVDKILRRDVRIPQSVPSGVQRK
jgi:general secretion pathway protein D